MPDLRLGPFETGQDVDDEAPAYWADLQQAFFRAAPVADPGPKPKAKAEAKAKAKAETGGHL